MGRHSESGLVDRLISELSAANQKIGQLTGQVATLTGERDEARRRSNHHRNMWGCADREVKRLRAKYGEPTLPAPAPQAEAIEPTPPAADLDATQLMSMAEIRDATGNGDTQNIPVVPEPKPEPEADPLPPLTWGVGKPQPEADTTVLEAVIAPPPGAGATDIPNSAGLQAVTRVLATTAPSTD